MKKILLTLVIVAIVLFSSCGFPGEPMLDDMYTRDVFPGIDSTYDVGAAGNEYAEGHFDAIWIAGAPAGGGAGGLYGINVEILAGDKTLTCGTDEIYQYLDPGGATRTITLDTASATTGDRFIIRNNDLYTHTAALTINQAAVLLDTIYANDIRNYIFDGTNWVAAETGTGEAGAGDANIAIGSRSRAYTQGVAIGNAANASNYGASVGYYAQSQTNGVAIGFQALGSSYGVAIGYGAEGNSYGIAIGYSTDTNNKKYSIALGHYAETERTGETSIAIDGTSDQENNVVQGRWALQTNNDTPVEMFCGGINLERFTIRASSVLAFRMIITARDNVAGHVAMYTVNDGLIKRDAANNTVMVNCTVVVVHEDDAAWDVAVTADDTNEALIITVTGDGANITQWVAVMDGCETHF